jgi:hypothetical protein
MKWQMMQLRFAFIALIALTLGGCSTLVQLPATNAPISMLAAAEDGYARVLQKHVNNKGEVDFSALREDRGDSGIVALEQYLRVIAVTPLDSGATANLRLAHMINGYNALSMYNVIALGIPASHGGVAKAKFFLLRTFEIGGNAMSLYAFENDIIRKLNEPRIHFALNCSAVSCPVLPKAPFSAANLDAELDREARNFFARAGNLVINHTAHTIAFNEILKFYTKDFTPSHAPSLIAYAQRFVNQKLPLDYQVIFTPYDWTVANSKR